MSEVLIAGWRGLAAEKREANLKKIPESWRLPNSLTAQFTETSAISVIDVPLTCGLLTSREVELTSNYDASKSWLSKSYECVTFKTAYVNSCIGRAYGKEGCYERRRRHGVL